MQCWTQEVQFWRGTYCNHGPFEKNVTAAKFITEMVQRFTQKDPRRAPGSVLWGGTCAYLFHGQVVCNPPPFSQCPCSLFFFSPCPTQRGSRRGGGWHKALVVGSVSLWRRLLASRL